MNTRGVEPRQVGGHRTLDGERVTVERARDRVQRPADDDGDAARTRVGVRPCWPPPGTPPTTTTSRWSRRSRCSACLGRGSPGVRCQHRRRRRGARPPRAEGPRQVARSAHPAPAGRCAGCGACRRRSWRVEPARGPNGPACGHPQPAPACGRGGCAASWAASAHAAAHFGHHDAGCRGRSAQCADRCPSR